MMANKRLKRLKKKVETKEKLINTLFYDPLKPLNLKSRLLSQYDKVYIREEDGNKVALRRQNNSASVINFRNK